MNKENQAKIIELVKQAKPLILQEMAHEKVTEKGAADYVTNVDVAVQNYLKEALGKEFPDPLDDTWLISKCRSSYYNKNLTLSKWNYSLRA